MTIAFQAGNDRTIGFGDNNNVNFKFNSATGLLEVNNTNAVTNLNASQLLGATWAAPPEAGIGSTTPRPIAATTGTFSGSLSIISASFNPLSLERISDNANAQGQRFIKARGTVGAPAGVQSGDQMARYMASGYINDGTLPVAGNVDDFLSVFATENYTATARGRQTVLYVVPNGTATAQAALTLYNDLAATFGGNAVVQGGTITAGVAATTRGNVIVRRGASDAPGYVTLMSANGTAYHLAAGDDGKLYLDTSTPTNQSGTVVGTQS